MKPFVVLLVLLSASLAGCFGGSKNVDARCNDVAEYQASRDVPGVQVPEGLVAPNRASVYVVPPATEAELRGAACLARPPPYFRPDPAAATPPPAPPAK
ncbi:MAG: hypothetical protein JNK40_06815 [Chromatiales bacterium]|nr:hypothetical protein [Chromatiales bacterium]